MTQQKSLTPRATAELLALAAIWGGSFLAIHVAIAEIGTIEAVAHRVLWAALALWIVLALRRQTMPRAPRVWGAFLVMGLLNNVIPFGLIFWGQRHIETGLAAILNASTALFGLLIAACLFRDERLRAHRIAGVALGLVGVAIVVGPAQLAKVDLRSGAQLAILGASVSYAFAGAWARLRLGALRPEVAACGMLTASAAVMVPAALLVEGPPRLDLALTTWAAIAYYALAATALAYLLYYRVLAAAGSGNLLLCTLLIAPIAVLLGALVLGETLPPRAFAGFAILAAGLLVIDGRLLPRRRTALAPD